MATIVLTYKGRCNEGPWNGQWVEAERSIIRDDLLGDGAYRHNGNCWQWKPPEMAIRNH